MDIPLRIPDRDYLAKIGEIVFLVSELEGLLKGDMYRFHDQLPAELDISGREGRKVTTMTTHQLGAYFVEHAPKCKDLGVERYFCQAGEVLKKIAKKRNSVLHSVPAIDGGDPSGRLRLGRVKLTPTKSEIHVLSDEWLDEFKSEIRTLRASVVSARPVKPTSDASAN